jgi:hypothetical protein
VEGEEEKRKEAREKEEECFSLLWAVSWIRPC